MFKSGKKVSKPTEYRLIVTRYGSVIPITMRHIGQIPKGKRLVEVWNESVKEFVGENLIELDKNYLSDDVKSSLNLIEIAFVDANTHYYECHTGPLADINAAGFHRCQADVAHIIEQIKGSCPGRYYADLMILKDSSGGYYINDACMGIISDLDMEHKPLHIKGNPDHKDNYFVVGDHCFNAKNCKNYYEYMEALIGPRPWMVE